MQVGDLVKHKDGGWLAAGGQPMSANFGVVLKTNEKFGAKIYWFDTNYTGWCNFSVVEVLCQ